MATKKPPTPVVPAPPYGRPLNKEEIEFVNENMRKQQEHGKKKKEKKDE